MLTQVYTLHPQTLYASAEIKATSPFLPAGNVPCSWLAYSYIAITCLLVCWSVCPLSLHCLYNPVILYHGHRNLITRAVNQTAHGCVRGLPGFIYKVGRGEAVQPNSPTSPPKRRLTISLHRTNYQKYNPDTASELGHNSFREVNN